MNENTDNKARLIEELKPCPFCGSTKVHMEGHHWIMCAECLADGPGILGTPEAEAIEAWNRRIEAAGLLAGSVGVPSVKELAQLIASSKREYNVLHGDKALPDFFKGETSQPLVFAADFIAGKIRDALLTRSPEPKGRWISEDTELPPLPWSVKVDRHPMADSGDYFTSMRVLDANGKNVELYDGEDQSAEDTLRVIVETMNALRTAPRAKEE